MMALGGFQRKDELLMDDADRVLASDEVGRTDAPGDERPVASADVLKNALGYCDLI